MPTVEQPIDVNVDVSTAYDQWVGGKPGQRPDSGEASFEPLGDSGCRVTFVMSWEPEGEIETPTEALEAVNQVVAADLARFKDFIEARGEETGSRRVERLLKTRTD